jgi:hypothetical protein
MQFRIEAADLQLAIAALLGLAGVAGLLRRLLTRGPGSAFAGDARRLGVAGLAGVALLSGAIYFGLGRHPDHFVKTWDVQHSYFGSKYSEELGYFRIYECMLFFDAAADGAFRGLPAVRDLRTQERVPPAEALRSSDCEARFTPERRRSFIRDLRWFQALPRQPHAPSWFTDNGYNQTPFFTALSAPLFEHLPLDYGLFLALALLDVGLGVGALLVAVRCFGPRAGLLAAIFFFTNFSNQFAMMGGAILRTAYLSLLILSAAAIRIGRPAAGGSALGLATLLQVFPAAYAVGLGLWAAVDALRRRRLPEWAPRCGLGFLATLSAGLVFSVAVAGAEAWAGFLERIVLHGEMLSEYRVGLKLLFVLDWPVPPGGRLPYEEAMRVLGGRLPLYHALGAALVLGGAWLARRLDALGFSIFLGTVILYVITPVHYYFAVLVLLFFLERELAWPLTGALLFSLTAIAYLAYQLDGSLALVNGYVLSIGLLGLLGSVGVAAERRRGPEAPGSD